MIRDKCIVIKKNKYDTKDGPLKIIERKPGEMVKVKFKNTGYITKVHMSSVFSGSVKDYLKPSVYDIGYPGEEFHEIKNKYGKIHKKIYKVWHAMISRCYNISNASYAVYGGKGTCVHKSWHNYSKFFYDVIRLQGYDENKLLSGKISLDKDKLQNNLEIKLYSKNTCCWLNMKEQYEYIDTSKLNNYIESAKKKFIAISPDNVEIKCNGISEFARKYNLIITNISKCLLGERKSHKGWKFKYE